MDQVDSKYIGLVSSRLQKFKRVKSNLYNFRCPICGDSQRNKNKARGYFYVVKNNTNFKCHNCGASLSFNNFIKKVDVELYKQYTLEKFKEGFSGRGFTADSPTVISEIVESSKPRFVKDPIKSSLPKASEVRRAKEYLEMRNIDPTKFYYAERFKEFTNSVKQTFDDVKYDEDRIIIPLYKDKRLIGFQGRSIDYSPTKYITVMLNENEPKIYGLDNINKESNVYIIEGPFDSTFIDNSIAMCGADVDVNEWNIENPVYVYDNEPRNKEIVNRISKVIDKGYKVVIWPTSIVEKDINDMVLSGLDVQNVVESNVYSSLQAKIKFNYWKKI